jgi:hypothetical protein
LICGFVLACPADLAVPHGHRPDGALAARRAAGCEAHRPAGEDGCRIAAPAPGVRRAADDSPAYVSVADDLGACTPFLAIDGERTLDFDVAHGEVVETVTPSGPQRSGGGAATTRVGTFSTAERASRVVTVLAGVRRRYTLIIPAEGTQCILALGGPQAVNLERSWFGQASDGPDLDRPAFEHAAARRFQGGRGPRGHGVAGDSALPLARASWGRRG